MTEHTPTPWVDPGEHDLTKYGDINHVIVGADGKLVGSLYANCFGSAHMGTLPSLAQAAENVALIFKAVNNHEALVKALQAALVIAESEWVFKGAHPMRTAALRDMRDVLAAVGTPRDQS